jgi:hypothetical protein
MTWTRLDGDGMLEFFDRFRHDGDYRGRLSIDLGAAEAIVAPWNDAAPGRSGGADDDIADAVGLMRRFAKAEPKPISVAPAEFTAPGRTGRLDTLDKYRTANAKFAFELGLRRIGLRADQIPEGGRLADGIIACLGEPGCKEGKLRCLLRLLRASVQGLP